MLERAGFLPPFPGPVSPRPQPRRDLQPVSAGSSGDLSGSGADGQPFPAAVPPPPDPDRPTGPPPAFEANVLEAKERERDALAVETPALGGPVQAVLPSAATRIDILL